MENNSKCEICEIIAIGAFYNPRDISLCFNHLRDFINNFDHYTPFDEQILHYLETKGKSLINH